MFSSDSEISYFAMAVYYIFSFVAPAVLFGLTAFLVLLFLVVMLKKSLRIKAIGLFKFFYRWLFAIPQNERTAKEIIFWWEKRRVPYNLMVGIWMMISFILFVIFILASGELKPGEDIIEPMAILFVPVIIFVVNVAYTFGTITELILRLIFPVRARRIGAFLLGAGIGFSGVVVAFPALYWGGFDLLKLLRIVH